MSTALDAGVPGSNLFRGFFSYFYKAQNISAYCKFGSFREVLFSRNFSHAKFRENKIIAKWRNHCYLLALVTNFDVANMSFNAYIRVFFSEFTVACVVTEVFYMYLIHVKGIKIIKK